MKIKELGIPRNISCYFHAGLREKIQQLEDHVIDTDSLEKRSLETVGEVGRTALQILKFSVIQDIELKQRRAEK